MINIEAPRAPKLPELKIPEFFERIKFPSIIKNLEVITRLMDEVEKLGFSPRKFLNIVIGFLNLDRENLSKIDFNTILLELYSLIKQAQTGIEIELEKFLERHPILRTLFNNIKNNFQPEYGGIPVELAVLLFIIGLAIIALLVVGTGNLAIGQVLKLEELNKVLGGQK